MAHTAFVFPGQGAQYVGMGSDLYEKIPVARARFDAADQALGFPLSAILFGTGHSEADAEALRQTDITQPALYLHSLAVMAALQEKGVPFQAVAGHSLGEYSALAAAGAIAFEDGLRIVHLRGRLMAEAGQERSGTMAAVIGMDDADAEDVCREASRPDNVVQPANYNSPGQIVVSGDVDAIERVGPLLSARGARKVIPLPVSGAFHSPLMAHARDGLATALSELAIDTPICPIYLNVTARPTTDPEEIRARLLEQLLAPVRWAQTLVQMHADGCTRFVEIGAGRVLSGLAKRTLGREVDTLAVGTADDVEALTN